MTYHDISHWTISSGKYGMLLFAQSLEELLAPHSYDSHRVPALNFHYICYEILHVIRLIEDDALDKGNLIPLISEMQTLFLRDSIAQKILGNNFEAIFAKKNSKGEYERKPFKVESGKDVDSILSILKKGTQYVVAELGRNDQYYFQLTLEAKSLITASSDDLLRLEPIVDLTKTIASELINMGFSQSYIYDCIKQTFFDAGQPVDRVEVIDDFFKHFSSTHNKYSVYLPLNSVKQKRALEDYGPLKIAENVYEMFNSSIPYILKYNCEASDPYAARERALELINFCLSVNQFIRHNKYDYNPKYTEVVDNQTHTISFIKKPESPIVHENSNCEELKVNDLLDTCLELNAGVFQVLQLHSAALISKNTDNQLINLWTAVEVAVPVVRKDNLSRINQISNTLTAALGGEYFYNLIHQLLSDIKIQNIILFGKIEQIDYNGSQDSKLLAILTLEKYADLYDEISQTLVQSAPLLACRMHRYKNSWSNTESIKKHIKCMENAYHNK